MAKRSQPTTGDSLKRVQLRESQKHYVRNIEENEITFCYGPAGTSKTFTACYVALKMLSEKKIKEIILCKPIQEAGEKLGFLPGDKDEKIDPYMKSYKSNIEKIIGVTAAKTLFDKNIIRFEPLAYMRGDTFDNSLMILDEAQNATPSQIKMLMTRIAEGSKIIINGDVEQTDRRTHDNGLLDLQERIDLHKVPGMTACTFDRKDIRRHKIIEHVLKMYQ